MDNLIIEHLHTLANRYACLYIGGCAIAHLSMPVSPEIQHLQLLLYLAKLTKDSWTFFIQKFVFCLVIFKCPKRIDVIKITSSPRCSSTTTSPLPSPADSFVSAADVPLTVRQHEGQLPEIDMPSCYIVKGILNSYLSRYPIL